VDRSTQRPNRQGEPRVTPALGHPPIIPGGTGGGVLDLFDGFANPLRLEILHLSGAKGEVGRQLVGEPEGDGEAVLDVFDGFTNPLRLAAYSAASHLPRPAGRWRM
jgi:hypothetical protein